MEVEDTAEAASVVAEAAMSEVEAEGSAASGGCDVRRRVVVRVPSRWVLLGGFLVGVAGFLAEGRSWVADQSHHQFR